MFSVSGTHTSSGKVGTITWDDGTLSGEDDELLGYVLLYFRLSEDRTIGPIEGPYTEKNHIESPISAVMILDEIFESAVFTGDVPSREALPFGVIG